MDKVRWGACFVMCVAVVTGSVGVATAAGLERLLMPGAVAAAHADHENDCSKCHDPFRPSSERRLCLECHTEVATDVDAGIGLHGRTLGGERAECRTCHTEHRGRAADIVGLYEEAFDHAATDFALEGAHRSALCDTCHSVGEKHRDAPSECAQCHATADAHQGRLGENCGACHSAATWRDGRFDHDSTRFRLRDAHAAVACAACHPDEMYAETPPDCFACHRLDDAHRGARGLRCGECHATVRWDRPTFDHDTSTRFPLRGSHVSIPCDGCHDGGNLGAAVPTDCRGCHQADDVHAGQLGTSCGGCHGETGWRVDVRFDHDVGAFPLIGMHAIVPCEQCHLSGAYRDAPVECRDCHATNDVHANRLGVDCARCHNPNGWPFWRFDHTRETTFALVGGHAGLECEACHTRPTVADVARDSSCVSCHRSDDVHEGAYGLDCARCHSAAGFLPAKMSR